MAQTSCLYRRPSGIYVVRLVVPKRLRAAVGKNEIHASTRLREWEAAKLIAHRIQSHWRGHFMMLDIEKLRAENPLLDGEGMIPIVEAARTVGMQPESLANELLNDGAHVFTHLHGQSCWRVPVLNDLDRDFGGEFIWNEVEINGERTVHTGTVRILDGRATLQQVITAGAAQEGVFRDGKSAGIFLEDPIAIDLSRCIVHKTAVTKVRVRLVASLSPAPTIAPPPPPIISSASIAALSVPSPSATVGAVPTGLPTRIEPTPVVFDPITAKHGKKRFWDLFELYARNRTWGEDQTRRMTTEARLFRDLMGDPELGEIELETIDQYASRLAQLPSDIYLAKRRFGTDSLDDLIRIAEREGLERKREATIKGHVGRLSEILAFGERKHMLRFNPASDYKRGDGRFNAPRAQDERHAFTSQELSLIFAQDWFATGAGAFNRTGWTTWRPHYYWLPLLGLFTGGRINELCQLYLSDIHQTEGGAWYLDFNLMGPDKVDESDKSLKTINALRVVPLHDRLVQLGLPEYVQTLRKAGYTRLFPELKRDAVKGYGKPASSWFNERFLGRTLGIERNGMKTFHSFRHTFLTATERLGTPERVMAQIAGHQRGDTESWNRYAKDRDADQLAAVINGLTFPESDSIAPFIASDGIRAIECAKRQKDSVRRGSSSTKAD
ncbi:site-specific integrase [Burkholderia pseudomallei]|uniref:site-specific integrase n=1 Tax=Burkholderia pseudomallei TaxID=28450 RepID=UPI0006DBDFA8|nr:site-specific integrase [Burkholderia pseudomallei]BEH31525.1 site-specific integrase [Burkholderia pseudomallei]